MRTKIPKSFAVALILSAGVQAQELPEEQRAALSLVVLEGLSYAQAAEVLETPIGTIMSRIARARAALSKALRVESVPIGAGLVTGAGPVSYTHLTLPTNREV